MTLDDKKSAIEAMLFASSQPVSSKRLSEALGADVREVKAALSEMRAAYQTEERGFLLKEIADGWQLFSNPAFVESVKKLKAPSRDAKMTQATLDTLTIIAYRQPIIRADIESIRGVAAGPILRTLIEKDLIRIVGRSEVVGRPFLYGTTKNFLKRFGLASVEDLPKPENLGR
jgi:segregation and condensation protein B